MTGAAASTVSPEEVMMGSLSGMGVAGLRAILRIFICKYIVFMARSSVVGGRINYSFVA